MAEGTFRSYNPLMYHVNSVSDFDPELVNAYKTKNVEVLKKLLDVEKYDYDVFICVNKSYHAFVMLVGVSMEEDKVGLNPKFSENPFDVPEFSFVFQFELRFEMEEQRTYKLAKKMETFKNMKDKIHRSYYIGRYEHVAVRAFQLAALRAAPTRYSVLLDDCVGFAKEFCISLLSYCDNWRTLEKTVEENIKKATASGLSVEQLSRRVKSSAYVGNTFLAGLDATTFLGERPGPVIAAVLVFILAYTIFVAVIVSMTTVYFMKHF